LVSLDGALDRLLRRPVQVLEQPADMVLVVTDTQLPLDDFGDAGARPDLAAKAVSLGAVPEEFRDRPQFVRGESGPTPRRRTRPKCLRSAVTGTSEPTADGFLGDIESLGDIALIPAVELQIQGTESPPFATLRRDGREGFHPEILL